MKGSMDHDTVSELLDRYVRGELAREQADEVGAHLTDCADCSSELIALQALGAGAVPAPLTELERAGLRRAVLSQAVPLPEPGVVAAPASSSLSQIGSRW